MNSEKCNICKSENIGNSPCGFYCNNCGYCDPCYCWRDAHKECMEHMNRIREETKYPQAKSCCCGRFK